MVLDCSPEFLTLESHKEKHLCVYFGQIKNKCFSSILGRVSGMQTYLFCLAHIFILFIFFLFLEKMHFERHIAFQNA